MMLLQGLINFEETLKSDSRLSKKMVLFASMIAFQNWNAFYLILKALIVLKIFKFLSWIFGHPEKTTWLER